MVVKNTIVNVCAIKDDVVPDFSHQSTENNGIDIFLPYLYH